MKKKTQKLKRKWSDVEITKIKLDPEQAVLGCCQGSADTWCSTSGQSGVLSVYKL